VESQEFGNLGSVRGVLVNTQFEVFGEGSVEFIIVLLVLCDLRDEFQSLLDEVLSDNLQDLVLLERLSGDVQRQVLGVDDTDHEVEVFGDQLIVVLSDEHPPDVELNVVPLLLLLKQVERSSLRGEQHSFELELTLNREVLDGKVVFQSFEMDL